ncbi:MAG: hypothetical protein IGR93_13930 [Hydrococcus sp. C42_A2020_068]|uniref:hypothetical protein n=1 Tax=Pleurocapsa sp. PCC 7327 TaxID=118163 RepID=UPI00029FDDB2|nr:hypothetical protein [Pleurocapsa sp. PCC 7327]AFY79592.1 hypothetical protein Ple7327_4491 [Pleurocapsa sp. PCC 7327]MBF2021168.1 hypothetical protein [Hydrococcus sp. C42_A2020_068]
MKLPKLFLGTTLLAISSLSLSVRDLSAQEPEQQLACFPLQVIGGSGEELSKTVSPPSVPLFNNNWNTDFAVDARADYDNYVATLTPEHDGEYSIKMYLKYSNNTTDKFYDQKVVLSAGQPLTISATPRRNEQPYQVNIFVGGLVSVGKTYRLTVEGCSQESFRFDTDTNEKFDR